MMINPKLAAINNAENEAPQIEAQVPDVDKAALEQQFAALEREINALPDSNPMKQKLQGDLRMAASGGLNAQALSSISQETNNEQAKANAEEGREIQREAGAAIIGLSGIEQFARLDGKLGDTGQILFKNHINSQYSSPGELMIESSGPQHHFNPGVINPGVQVAIMPAIDKGQGIGLAGANR